MKFDSLIIGFLFSLVSLSAFGQAKKPTIIKNKTINISVLSYEDRNTPSLLFFC